MFNDKYILDENNVPKQAPNLIEWAKWYETARSRSTAKTDINGVGYVSTVFLGVDHRWEDSGLPMLWETMIFYKDGTTDDLQDRYTSHYAALVGHAKVVRELVERLGVSKS